MRSWLFDIIVAANSWVGEVRPAVAFASTLDELTVGLAAFAYALVHAVIYMVRTEVWRHWNDLLQPYLVIGMTGLVLMLPMAATSSQAMARALGASARKRLHQVIYLVAPLGIVHAVLVDRWDLDAWIYGGTVALLLAWRLRGLKTVRAAAHP